MKIETKFDMVQRVWPIRPKDPVYDNRKDWNVYQPFDVRTIVRQIWGLYYGPNLQLLIGENDLFTSEEDAEAACKERNA